MRIKKTEAVEKPEKIRIVCSGCNSPIVNSGELGLAIVNKVFPKYDEKIFVCAVCAKRYQKLMKPFMAMLPKGV